MNADERPFVVAELITLATDQQQREVYEATVAAVCDEPLMLEWVEGGAKSPNAHARAIAVDILAQTSASFTPDHFSALEQIMNGDQSQLRYEAALTLYIRGARSEDIEAVLLCDQL